MSIPTPYDKRITELQVELRALRRKQREARARNVPKPKFAKRSVRAKKRPADVELFWARLREMGCIVTGATDDVTIHHCHSGSLADIGVNRGGGQKSSDFLVIPLHRTLHCIGPGAIDGAKGVRTWEAENGTQVSHLDEIVRRTGVDVWAKAGVKR